MLRKGVYAIWIYGWLGKIQWNFITWKIRLWQPFKHGRYCWCRLHVCRILGEHHDLYVESGTLFLVDVFANFPNMCFEIYELDPARLFTGPRLEWQATLKKPK